MSDRKQRAICILGMHRSGTSALARALNLLGAYIGPERKIMPARDDNPAGFWEHLDIYRFHERLLGHLAIPWDSLFPPPHRWWKQRDIEPYRKELAELVMSEYGGHNLWMWKDPRTSVLLPLWQEVLSSLAIEVRYIICWRHPADVAASLQRRNGFSKEKAYALWQFHNLSCLYWTNGLKRTVVRYDDLVRDLPKALSTVVGFLALPLTGKEKELDAASGSIRPDLCHSESDRGSLMEDPEVSVRTKKIFEFLAGWDGEGAQADRAGLAKEMTGLYDEYCGYASLFGSSKREDEIRQKDAQIGELMMHIRQLKEEVQDKIANLGLRADALHNKDMHIQDLMEVIRNKDLRIANLEAAEQEGVRLMLQQSEEIARLKGIENSLSWRTIRAFLDSVDRILGRNKKLHQGE